MVYNIWYLLQDYKHWRTAVRVENSIGDVKKIGRIDSMGVENTSK